MAERVEPRTLQGTMELLPPDQILFNRMYDTIRGVYESFGFLPCGETFYIDHTIFRDNEVCVGTGICDNRTVC